jgi:hypothetical protein
MSPVVRADSTCHCTIRDAWGKNLVIRCFDWHMSVYVVRRHCCPSLLTVKNLTIAAGGPTCLRLPNCIERKPADFPSALLFTRTFVVQLGQDRLGNVRFGYHTMMNSIHRTQQGGKVSIRGIPVFSHRGKLIPN